MKTRIAVISEATGEVENVLVFTTEVPEAPKGYKYIEDKAIVATIGEVKTEQELSADPVIEEPEPPEKTDIEALIEVLNTKGITITKEEVNATKRTLEQETIKG
jgi:hypothetical protein